MLEASACNMLRYMPPHATLKLGSTVGDMMRKAGFTSRLRTLVIVWTRALMLSQAPSVFLICVIQMTLWSAQNFSTKKACDLIPPSTLLYVIYVFINILFSSYLWIVNTGVGKHWLIFIGWKGNGILVKIINNL